MATKASPQDIKDLGFVAEHFGDPLDFDAFIQAILDEQEALLSDRVGISTLANPSLATNIKRTEKCMSAAELLQRRINRLSGNVDPETGMLILQLKRARQDYQEEAEKIIPKLVSGAIADGSDAAFGQSSSSHFDGVNS